MTESIRNILENFEDSNPGHEACYDDVDSWFDESGESWIVVYIDGDRCTFDSIDDLESWCENVCMDC
jgi:hypothetical protein